MERRVLSFWPRPLWELVLAIWIPGNWATDLWNRFQIWLQTIICALLSILWPWYYKVFQQGWVLKRKDLAQINKTIYPRKLNFHSLYSGKIAIIATDLARSTRIMH